QQYRGPVVEPLVLGLETQHEWMLRVDLEDRFGIRQALTGGLEHSRQVTARSVFIGDQTGWRLGQSPGDANVPDSLAQTALNLVDQRPEFGRLVIAFFAFGLVFECA